MLTMNLTGIVSIRSETGVDRTPRGNKARALLAMLALSPKHVRTRTWLQDKLWSDRGPEQAAGSLRQALTEIRGALREDKDVLKTDGRSVWLDESLIRFDIDTKAIAPLGPVSQVDVPELLEGIAVRDIEYQDWHRGILQVWHRNVDAQPDHSVTPPAAPPVVTSRPEAPPWPGPIRFLASGATRAEHHFSQMLSSLAMQAVKDSGFPVAAPRLLQPESGEGHFCIETRVGGLQGRSGVTIAVLAPNGLVAWCESLEIGDRTVDPETNPMAIRLVHEAVDALFEALVRNLPKDNVSAGVLGILGARKVFSLGSRNFAEAEALFAQAAQDRQSGIHEAWLACLTTMMAGEGGEGARAALEEKAVRHARIALELDPHNAQVLALCGHAFNYVSRDFFTGYELSRRAIERSPYNPLATTIHATSNFYLGRYDQADRLARIACGLASNGPYRYFADTSRLIAAALAGDYSEALRLATVTHSLKPDYLPPLRYLATLNLKIGNRARAAELLDQIRQRIPGFSLEEMQANSNRIPGYAGSDLFRFKPREIE